MGLALLVGAGCATTGTPAARPAPPTTPGPVEAGPTPSAPAPVTPPTATPTPHTPSPTAVTAPQAWVNPARCHTRCAFDPGDRRGADPSAGLVRVDDQGAPAAKGRHQIAAEVQAPLRDLLAAARAAGHVLKVNSAYRSYREQARVWKTTRQPGRAARPGHSEHQLGTAIDLRLPTSAAIDWLGAHAAEFGFVRSYPDGKQRITGYRPEPWHVRWVGVALAGRLATDGVGTLEELFRKEAGAGESGTCADCPLPASRALCGDVTAAGTCRGDVLVWCYDGALAAVDCTASEQHCGPPDNGGPSDCR
jgi:D-alanyl-D-alanine carboxypeptidase